MTNKMGMSRKTKTIYEMDALIIDFMRFHLPYKSWPLKANRNPGWPVGCCGAFTVIFNYRKFLTVVLCSQRRVRGLQLVR